MRHLPNRNRYARPNAQLARAEKFIPLSSQIFSRSRNPRGRVPLILTHGHVGRVWDVNGNECVDLVCGLLPVMLGHCDPHVDGAIRGRNQAECVLL
jgi:glutamate-1-semialdehyde 2,1-aminomutase